METDSSTSTTMPHFLLCTTTVVIALISLFLLAHARNRKNPKAGSLPPGPPALLFLAKFLALRRSIFDLAPLLRDMHARYGPVISLRLARTLVFVANRRLAHRLLVQGGATFDDRPPPVDPNSLFTAGGRDVASSPYGSYWRLVRRNLAGEALQPARVALFAPARRWACDGLVDRLRRQSASRGAGDDAAVTLRPSLRRAMFELLVYMCFGAQLGQDALDEMERLQHRVLVLSLTTFPIFAFFPAVTKRLFRSRWEANVALRRRQDELFVPLIHATRGNDDPPCYADSLRALRVPDEGDRQLTDAEMVSLCSEFLNAGTDTTVTLVEWIMAELVNHPDVQAKVHEEVIRSSSNPGEHGGGGDVQVQAMPYLKAVALEGLRLHPPGHFVLPHGVRTDNADVGGYAVPRGAEVNFLVAEIGRDETVWKSAREFRPDRFLDGGEGCGVDITGSREIKMMPFGAGRRMCPGYSLGIHHAEYFVARMVRDLEWQPPVDGVAVDMAEEVDFTVVMKQPLCARIVAKH
ncbi:cytochrome P450 89A2-like [Miscanthus floridulus]|uniref:cytochrome P450 89A2-like n=1 Tax=Miscanthus floridulus TaxID=154761 RepID=UPI003458D1F8